jgi:hypothetical protein
MLHAGNEIKYCHGKRINQEEKEESFEKKIWLKLKKKKQNVAFGALMGTAMKNRNLAK